MFLILSCCLASAERPNIIFILTDDQRKDSLPVYGNDFVKTPHLDAMAKESIVFDKAAVNSAICTPSRACYFLGQYERRHAINFNSGTALAKKAWDLSYPMQLRKAGYFTGYVGKNHVPVGAEGYKTGLIDESFDYWYAGHGHIFFYPKTRHDIFKGAKADTQIEIVHEGAEGFLSGAFISGARTFLENRPKDQPFCLSICLNTPHGAGVGTMKMLPTDPELYRTRYRGRMEEIGLPETYIARADLKEPKLPKDVLRMENRQEIYDYVNQPETLRERLVRKYQTITGIDLMIGGIRGQLKELGLEKNTVLIFTSDHGILLGEHGLGGKALNYEPCLNVPLIIHDPRLPEARKGKRSNALTESVDIAATILDLAGLSSGSEMQGRSLVDVLAGETDFVRDYSFAENLWSNVFGNPRCESLRGQRFKYIRYFSNPLGPWKDKLEDMSNFKRLYAVTPAMVERYQTHLTSTILGEPPVYEELFDLESDPGETRNLAEEEDYASVLNMLRARCQARVTLARGDFSKALLVDVLPESR